MEELGNILFRCIEQAEELNQQIQNDCQVPPDCFGGQMCFEYEKVREHQFSLIKTICNQLGML